MIRGLARRMMPGGRLVRDERGAAMVEFALIALLFFVIVFGICEMSLMLFQWKSAEKAVQLGARMAIVSNRLPGVPATNTKVSTSVDFGEPCSRIASPPCTDFGTVSCTGSACGTDGTYIITRMQEVFPQLQPAEVTISYQYAALGFVGGPTWPAVTVTVSRPFNFIVLDNLLAALGGSLPSTIMNVKSATLTGEDHAI